MAEDLMQRRVKPAEVVILLVDAALNAHEYSKARLYVDQLPEQARIDARRRLQGEEASQAILALDEKADLSAGLLIAEQFQHQLIDCNPFSSWFAYQQWLNDRRQTTLQLKVLKTLAKQCLPGEQKISALYALQLIMAGEPFYEFLGPFVDQATGNFKTRLRNLRIETLLQLATASTDANQQRHYIDLALTLKPHSFNANLALGWHYYHQQQFAASLATFDRMATRSKSRKIREGQIFAHAALGEVTIAVTLAEQSYMSKALLAVLPQRLQQLSNNDPEREVIAKRLLSLDRSNQAGLSALAWYYYNQAQWPTAITAFANWLQHSPNHPSATEGYVLSLLQHQQWQTAQQFCQQQTCPEPLAQQLRVLLASEALSAQQFVDAKHHAQSAYQHQPDDTTNQQLLAWSLFHNGEYAAARDLFGALYQQHHDATSAQGLLLCTQQQDPAQYQQWLQQFRHSRNPEVRLLAADQFANQADPITADQTRPTDLGTDRDYVNASQPWLGVSWHGNQFISNNSLSERHAPYWQVDFGLTMAEDWQLEFTAQHFNEGTLTSTAQRDSGSVFLGGSPELTSRFSATDYWLFTAQNSQLQFNLARLHSDNPLNARWLFGVKYQHEVGEFSLQQVPVFDSPLSLSGIADPYPTEPLTRYWGQVFKTQLGYQRQSATGPDWSVWQGQWHWYRGQAVADNQGWQAAYLRGRSFQYPGWQLSYGGQVWLSHDQFNSNFSYAGHGGYFSPQRYWQIGPLLSLQGTTRDWWQVSASIGYYQWRTDATALYPLQPERSEFSRDDDGRGISVLLNAEHHWLVSQHWDVAVAGQYLQAAQYRQWQWSIGVRYLWGERLQLQPHKSLLLPAQAIFNERGQ